MYKNSIVHNTENYVIFTVTQQKNLIAALVYQKIIISVRANVAEEDAMSSSRR